MCYHSKSNQQHISSQELRLSGEVRSFDDLPLGSAKVMILNHRFQPLAETKTDSDGRFSLLSSTGTPLALAIVRDYKEKYLEFWAWNLPSGGDLQVDAHIGGLEIYGLHVWKTWGGPQTLLAYFRPMSLKRFKRSEAKGGEMGSIVPELALRDVEIRINGNSVRLLRLDRIEEETGSGSLGVYLVQFERPKNLRRQLFCEVRIIVSDSKTLEKGEAVFYYVDE